MLNVHMRINIHISKDLILIIEFNKSKRNNREVSTINIQHKWIYI